jgi:hypothetical protein
MANLINSAEVRETWAPIIESATGINEAEKLAWMSEYCHNHKLYEDAHIMSLGTAGNIYGMGDVSLPSAAADGSGDKAPTLLPLAMQVAAQTIGLDLVPVVPMAGPMGLLSYLDFVYEGGKLAGDVAPTYIKTDAAKAEVNGNESSGGFTFTWIGSSRIDNMDIYKVAEAASTSGSVADAINELDTSTDGAGNAIVKAVELVKGLEDHIKGFAAADEDGNPFSRGAGEQTPDKVMGLSLFSKSVAAETFQVAAAVTREQVQDLKQFGVDAVAQVESVLTNELTQSINNLILAKLNSLGKSNAGAVDGAGDYTSADLDLELEDTLTGGETIASSHRRILTSILAAANYIANKGRRGAGNFCVVGPKVATALQSVAGFVANPMANTLSQAAGAIYPVGSVAGVNVYTDPRQAWGANDSNYEVVVGRKGDGNGPGLVFMPYLMAESVQTIAEGTMAPKVAVKSRFALVEAGFHPETQYVTYEVKGLAL